MQYTDFKSELDVDLLLSDLQSKCKITGALKLAISFKSRLKLDSRLYTNPFVKGFF